MYSSFFISRVNIELVLQICGMYFEWLPEIIECLFNC
jgi:hypothetical protein